MVRKFCQSRCKKKNYKIEISLKSGRHNLKVVKAWHWLGKKVIRNRDTCSMATSKMLGFDVLTLATLIDLVMPIKWLKLKFIPLGCWYFRRDFKGGIRSGRGPCGTTTSCRKKSFLSLKSRFLFPLDDGRIHLSSSSWALPFSSGWKPASLHCSTTAGNKRIENIQSEKPSSGISTAGDGCGNSGDNNGCNDSREVMVVIVRVIFMLVPVVMTKAVIAMLIMVMVVTLMRRWWGGGDGSSGGGGSGRWGFYFRCWWRPLMWPRTSHYLITNQSLLNL